MIYKVDNRHPVCSGELLAGFYNGGKYALFLDDFSYS